MVSNAPDANCSAQLWGSPRRAPIPGSTQRMAQMFRGAQRLPLPGTGAAPLRRRSCRTRRAMKPRWPSCSRC